MKRRTFWEACWIIAFLTITTALIAFADIDIRTSGLFYVPDVGFPAGDRQPWRALYLYGEYSAYLIAIPALVVLVTGLIKERFRPLRRQALFLVLVLVIGPGLIVNSTFKKHWGRPRPRQIVQFGGTQQFAHPWVKNTFDKGNSFPSGHASTAFYMLTPFFILRTRKKGQAKAWLVFGLSYGILMGAARVAQGGHFVSDVLWSGGFVYLTGLFLADFMGVDKTQEA